MAKRLSTVDKYLQQPYGRVLIPDEETHTFTARIVEFPGCVAQGDSPAEAYEHLEEAARNWLEATLEIGQKVPPPLSVQSHSGRIALRLPKVLHRQSAQLAEADGTSLNQFIVSALAEKVGASTLYHLLCERLEARVTIATLAAVQLTARVPWGASAGTPTWPLLTPEKLNSMKVQQ